MLKVERRTVERIPYKTQVRYVNENNKSTDLKTALAQNIGPASLQILSASNLTAGETIEIYLPTLNLKLIPARAHVVWTKLEAHLPDSPYWLSAGLRLEFEGQNESEAFNDLLSDKRSRLRTGQA